MSRLLRVTKPAQQDLEDIWLDLEAVGGMGLADRRLAAIQKKFLQLKQFPGVGRSREDLAPGLRSCVVNDVVILYRSLEGLLLIARVVQGRRDLKRLFSDTDEG
jgi:toxin ParE1/3/4